MAEDPELTQLSEPLPVHGADASAWLQDAEDLLLLLSAPTHLDGPNGLTLLNTLVQGDITNVAANESFCNVVCDASLDDFESSVSRGVERMLNAAEGPLQQEEKQFELLLAAVAHLVLFVQANWTGPVVREEVLQQVCERVGWPADFLATLHQRSLRSLQLCEEDVYPLTQHLSLLTIARAILISSLPHLQKLKSALWWSGRCALLHQSVLAHQVPPLQQHSQAMFEAVLRDYASPVLSQPAQFSPLKQMLAVRAYVEAAKRDNQYWAQKRMMEHLQHARTVSGLELKLTGALGVRTRYQRDQKTQLFLEATSSPSSLTAEGNLFPHLTTLVFPQPQSQEQKEEKKEKKEEKKEETSAEATQDEASQPSAVPIEPEVVEARPNLSGLDLPPDVALQDDTLLEHVRFQERIEFAPLSIQDQLIVLGLCVEQKSRSAEGDLLTKEEMLARLDRLLWHGKSWGVHTTALMLRSQIEHKERHASYRAINQIQALLDMVEKGKRQPSPAECLARHNSTLAIWRTRDVFCTFWPPVWEVKRALAHQYHALSFTKTALELFQQLHLWDDAIQCMIQIGLREDAERLIRSRLEVEPTPHLWCLLGDVLDQDEPYHTAWQVSGQRYARAQRSLADAARKREQHREALEHYTLALAINPLFPQCWYSKGWCALQLEELSIACVAFGRVVAIDPEYGEAWNNLAAVHLKTEQWPQALHALEQSSRLLRDNWKVWDNFLSAALHCQKWGKAIHALGQFLNLIPKDVLDIPTVRFLSQSVLTQLQANPDSILGTHMSELLDKITNKFPTNSHMWRIFSDFMLARNNIDKAVEYRKKQYQYVQAEGAWEKQAEQYADLVDLMTDAIALFQEHTPRSHDNFYWAKLEIERVVVKVNNLPHLSEHAATTNLQQALKTATQLAAQTAPAPVARPVVANDLSSMMSLWR
eukprot:TRINITY_DN1311_c0_g2_i2.p1 TRINITY_DN1311_c0_g2~~TRINITY_DN1311_c0_g2_i2.p1  ORF type:complete len:955 (+),score=300.22 TRINITY_DN1311_c0_g2_i2:74-2866(+)